MKEKLNGNGNRLMVGDRVRIISSSKDALGVEGRIGTVVPYSLVKDKSGKEIPLNKDTLFVHLDNSKNYMRVDSSDVFQIIERNNRRYFEIDIVIKEGTTKAIVGNNVGCSVCNTDKEEFIEGYGVLLAVARAYKIDEDKISKIIDILYSDYKDISGYTFSELVDELRKRG